MSMNMKQITAIEPGHRIPVPSEWASELGLENMASLEKTATGIVVRSCPVLTWDQVFEDKLSIAAANGSLEVEVTKDDLLF